MNRFFDRVTGNVGIHTEAAQSYALYFDLVPKDGYAKAVHVLLDDIKMHGGHISTGMFGTKYMLEALSHAGYGNTAYEMAVQRTFPGWGYMIANNATTIWEHWAFSDNTYSHNHPMFGSVSGWFYRHIAGIAPDTDAVAYNKIVICPDVIPGLVWAKASYHSANGLIESSWKEQGRQFRLDVAIPVNTTARIYVPARGLSAVTESGKSILKTEGIHFLKMKGNYVVLKAGSGNYHFISYFH